MAQALVSYFWKRPTGYPCAPWGQCGARGRHVGDRIFSTIQALKLVSLSDIKFGIHVCHESTHKKPDLKRHGKSAILLWMDFFEGLFCHKRAHLLRENCAAEIIWGGGGGNKRWKKKKKIAALLAHSSLSNLISSLKKTKKLKQTMFSRQPLWHNTKQTRWHKGGKTPSKWMSKVPSTSRWRSSRWLSGKGAH